MADDKILYTDSTHLKASANHKLTKEDITQSTKEYFEVYVEQLDI